MSSITRGRLLRINQTVLDQADYFHGDAFTRQTGLTVIDVASVLFYNNTPQPWTLANGAPVSDAQVRAGSVYFHEITGAPGYYSLRFRPNAAGYWRLVLTYATGQQVSQREYDITADPLLLEGGLAVSFIGS